MAAKRSDAVSRLLAGVPPEKRGVMSALRDAVAEKLPSGYEEIVQGKLIAYVVPLSRLAKTYNGHPLWYAAIAAQKNYVTLHLMSVYADAKEMAFLRAGFAKAGKRLDIGKACIRFKKLDDVPLDAIAASIARVPMEAYVARYESVKRK